MNHKSGRLTPITSLTARTSSTMKHLAQCSAVNEQVKQNQLQWRFNRRKHDLEKTSTQNVQIYLRIQSQKSGLSAFINKKNFNGPSKSSSRIRPVMTDKQNIDVHNQLKRRQKQIGLLLSCIKSNKKELTNYFV